MIDWKKYWNSQPTTVGERDFFEQVGKTVNKKPVSLDIICAITATIIDNLGISSEDDVLDICCGNGIITHEISKVCKNIRGIDYSNYLINIANSYKKNTNATYVVDDVMSYILSCNYKVDKIYMYEALQHFSSNDLRTIIINIKRLFKNEVNLFFGSVPDNSLKWSYYDTVQRKVSYCWRVVQNNEAIGTWWSKSEIEKICSFTGYSVTFIEQNKMLHTSRYRFDFLVKS